MTQDAAAADLTPAGNLRLAAARGLTQVVKHNKTLEWIRINRPQWLQTPLQRELLYGTTRHYLSLSQSVNEQLKRPLKSKDLDLHHLLIVGAYQLKYTDLASYAAINECVSACQALGKTWAKGLINGVLRSIQRQLESADQTGQGVDTAQADHPAWMTAVLTRQYGAQATELMQANNDRAPMTLRINTQAIDCEAYKEQLNTADIAFDSGPWPETVILHQPQTAADLPGWDQGQCAVQDLSAQHAARLLLEPLRQSQDSGLAQAPNPDAPLRILDACAAPGGKFFHLHEVLNRYRLPHHLWALDNNNRRLADLQAIGERLGHQVSTTEQDLSPDGQSETALEVDGALSLLCADGADQSLPFDERFDAILLDAPCSGSGTIRRNPDIRLLLEEQHLMTQQQLQLALLHNLWQQLKPGGSLLYSTCSVFAEENDQVIHRFLGNTPSARVQPLDLAFGQSTKAGWQLLPTQPATDGFYYSLLRKDPSP
jgi:16S rRNA (cytosine967-C5)-methyltransferase